MTDHDLSDLLERLGERSPVGPAPTAQMLADAGRSRRRRTTWVAAAAVLAVVGGVAVLGQQTGPGDGDGGPATDPTSGPTRFVPPAGTRLVGVGHAAIAVPEGWGTNELHCGTPQKDTVIVDQGAICMALVPRSAGIESILVVPGWYGGSGERGEVETQPVEIDGEAAERVPTTCRPEHDDVRVCRGAIHLPGPAVTFLADSSSADARAQVDEMLTWIHLVPGLTAVPGYQGADNDHQDDDAGEHYRAELAALGLEARTVTEKRPGMPAGYVLGVDPQPGTMLEPGATVTLTEVAEPEGPADEVNVSLSSLGPGDSMDYRGLEDAQIRAGGRVVVPLGGSVWIYPNAERTSGRIAGEVAGGALELDPRTEGPNVGRTWNAVRRGTATLTVVLDVDGRRHVIGSVTVVVE